jgi:hypothetical protein
MRTSAALLLGVLATSACQAPPKAPSDTPPETCEDKRALWDASFPRVAPGPPAARIKAIEGIAAQVGEDPEQCAVELVRAALQAERARLVTLQVGGASIPPAAVYACASLSNDLKCVSSVADDTAHLGEAPGVAVFPTGADQPARLKVDASLSDSGGPRVYTAAQSSLLDAPKYTELMLDARSGFTIPKSTGPVVLVIVFKEPDAGTFDKFVWLGAPR